MLIHKHREIKQIDNFKVGDTYKNSFKITRFSIYKGDFLMHFQKLTMSNKIDLRTSEKNVNLNKIY